MSRTKLITGILLAFATLCCAQSTQPSSQLKIGYDTTRINGPVLPDGTIDYATALWQSMSAGATPDNNANTLLQQAGGVWKHYAQGIKDDSEMNKLDRELTDARQKPWKSADLPDVAHWLTNNDAALRLVVEASSRPHLCPPSPEPGNTPNLTSLHLGNLREFADALRVRAMRRVALSDFDGARSDILAENRLATLLANAPDLIGIMVAMAMDTDASELAAARAAPNQAKSWLTQRLNTPEIRLRAPPIDIGNRYQDLTNVMMMLRGKSRDVIAQLTLLGVESMFTGKPNGQPPDMPGDLKNVDWNLVLRHINGVNDEAVRIVNEPDPIKRFAAIKLFSETLEKEQAPGNLFSDVMIGPWLKPDQEPTVGSTEDRMKAYRTTLIAKIETFLKQGADETREAYSLRIAQFFTHGASSLNSMLQLDGNADAKHALYTIAIALEIYKADHGNYPDSLAALAPQYLKTLPLDLYSGKDPIYRATDKTYLLYSVGPNGRDDGGERGGEKDDIVVK